MGGSPSEHTSTTGSNRKLSAKDKTQRYMQNKKGRTPFFMYHRSTSPAAVTSSKVQPPPLIISTTTKNRGFRSPPPPAPVQQQQQQLFMEAVVSPSSSDSDDSFTPATKTMTTASRTSTTTTNLVEPHIATRVQFSTVHIRNYTITIGDHPCCTVGCPITLDWEYTTQDSLCLDEYETRKAVSCQQWNTTTTCLSRKLHDLRISPEDRIELLLQCSWKHNATTTTTDDSSGSYNNNNTEKLSEIEIRRASRKFHRTKHCSTRQCERIHETFFHCPTRHHKGSTHQEDSDNDHECDDDDSSSGSCCSNTDDDDEDGASQ